MVGILSDIGNVRSKNEDFADYYEDDIKGIYIIADGMGGYNSGEVASKIAVKETLNCLKNITSDKDIEIKILEAIKNANSTIYDTQMEKEEYKGMGTTITSCILINNNIYVGHVGDSCCFYIDSNGINKLTKDHSLVQQMLDSGTITEAQALNHPQKNIITRALGTNKSVEIDIYKKSMDTINKIIICTDGLSNYVSENEIYNIIINTNNNVDSSKKLVNCAKDKGSRDNISVIVFEGEGKKI